MDNEKAATAQATIKQSGRGGGVPVYKSSTNSLRIVEEHTNTDQEVIKITADRAELCLIKSIARIRNNEAWTTPAGILLTIIITLYTANFTDTLGFDAATWKALFILCGLLSLCWTIKALIGMKKAITVGDILEMLKKQKANNTEG